MLVVNRWKPFKKTTFFSFPRTNHGYKNGFSRRYHWYKSHTNWSFTTTV